MATSDDLDFSLSLMDGDGTKTWFTLKEALEQLGFPITMQYRYRWRPLLAGKSRDSKDPTDYGPKQPSPSQIIFASLAMVGEACLLYSGIFTETAGLRKPISILNHVAYNAERLEQEWAEASKDEKKIIDCRPTIVVCHAELIDAWVRRFRYYQGILRLKPFYSSTEETQDADADTLNPNGELATEWLDTECDGKNPEHARVVVLSSYESLTERTLLSKPKAEFEGIQKQYDLINYPTNDFGGILRRNLPMFTGSWADELPTRSRLAMSLTLSIQTRFMIVGSPVVSNVSSWIEVM